MSAFRFCFKNRFSFFTAIAFRFAGFTFDEAEVLVQIFPENSFYDLQWDLLKLVESVIRIDDGDKYIQLINACPSQEWKGVLNIRYKNYKKSQEV